MAYSQARCYSPCAAEETIPLVEVSLAKDVRFTLSCYSSCDITQISILALAYRFDPWISWLFQIWLGVTKKLKISFTTKLFLLHPATLWHNA